MTGKIVIDAEICKSCGLCISACPRNSIVIAPSSNPLGYFPAQPTDQGCTGCGLCALMCPEAAITVQREVPAVSPPKKSPPKVGSSKD